MPSEIRGSDNFDSDSVGKVLQVVNDAVVGAFSTTSTTDVTTGHDAIITPSSTSNKVLVTYSGTWSIQASNTSLHLSLYRGATDLGEFASLYVAAGGWSAIPCAFSFLDSPASTSAETYTIYVREGSLAGTISRNSTETHTLTLKEIEV